jgi:hypothetical protein
MTKRERLIELAEVVRDSFSCNGDPSNEPCGSERGVTKADPYPHDDVTTCWHCFARWVLGEREPEWIDARPDCTDEECTHGTEGTREPGGDRG